MSGTGNNASSKGDMAEIAVTWDILSGELEGQGGRVEVRVPLKDMTRILRRTNNALNDALNNRRDRPFAGAYEKRTSPLFDASEQARKEQP